MNSIRVLPIEQISSFDDIVIKVMTKGEPMPKSMVILRIIKMCAALIDTSVLLGASSKLNNPLQTTISLVSRSAFRYSNKKSSDSR
jgi:hypothetical protein